MDILFIAPQPFYQQRGTPIAIRTALTALCQAGHRVDLLAYHEGEDLKIEGLRILRIAKPPFVSNVPIGLSWKKLVCDAYLSTRIPICLAAKHYDVIHAVEEAIFPALLANLFARKALIYDMDSSLAEQLTERWPLLYPMLPLLRSFERLAVRQSDAVLAVCQVLADKAAGYAADKPIYVLNDVALEAEGDSGEVVNLRDSLRLRGRLALYVGNLEHYQGIELMLEAFALLDGTEPVDLVVIGGNTDDIATYQTRAHQLGIADRTHFIGPRPLPHLSRYLTQADILLSPRLRGVNTPMKVYSYMLAGKAILATNIVSHTQVLNVANAALVDPTPAALAEGLIRLLRDSALRERLGIAAAAAVRRHYSHAEFERKLLGVYAELSAAGAVGAAERA